MTTRNGKVDIIVGLPVLGEVSQNCVCTSWPPGALKQHVFETTVVFWQLNWGLEQVTGDPARAPDTARNATTRAREATEAIGAVVE